MVLLPLEKRYIMNSNRAHHLCKNYLWPILFPIVREKNKLQGVGSQLVRLENDVTITDQLRA